MQRRKSNLTKPHGSINTVITVYTPTSNKTNRNNLKSSSFICRGTNDKEGSSKKVDQRTFGTQTSSTAITLRKKQHSKERMSPDSLSPKSECKHAGVGPTLIYAADGDNNASISFTRKQYLHETKHNKKDESTCDSINNNMLSGDGLVKRFLETRHIQETTSEASAPTRSNFLEQTSPFRKLALAIRSKSYIEPSIHDSESLKDAGNRFKVTSVRDNVTIIDDGIKPVRFYCGENFVSNVRASRSRSPNLCTTFMSPTIASEIKSQAPHIEKVRKRISPTRRGRSISPNTIEILQEEKELIKVPYIDKSTSTLHSACRGVIPKSCGDNSRIVLNLKELDEAVHVRNLKPTHSWENDIFQAVNKLKSPDWNASLLGLAEILEICRVSEREIIYPHMSCVNQRVIELLKSSRSHVCRTTCQAIGHLFEYVKDTRRPEFDEIVDILLCKSADSNKFIRHDANLALDCMVTHIPIIHSVRALCTKGPDHKNQLVRTATARLVVCAVAIAGPRLVLHHNSSDHTRRRIILNMVRFLNDKTFETRKFGTKLYRLLSSEKQFDNYLKKYLEHEMVLQVKGYMRSPNR